MSMWICVSQYEHSCSSSDYMQGQSSFYSIIFSVTPSQSLSFIPQHFTEVPERQESPLFAAAREGKLSAIQEQLEGRLHLINLVDQSDYNSILHLACEHHHLPVVVWSLQQQSRLMVNVSNREGKSAFFIACEKGFSDIVKDMLLSLSTTQPLIDINTASNNHSPMTIACKGGHVVVIKELLDGGGDKVDVNGVRNGSVLTNACDSGNMEVLELLLNHPKIDVNQKINKGSTLLHHVCLRNQLPPFQRLLQLPTLKLNQQTDLGLTPLMAACHSGKLLKVRELMKCKQINVNICDSQKRTALWFAAKWGKSSSFLSILCTSHGVIDTTTTPEGKEYLPQYVDYLVEYAADRAKFLEKYGDTQLPLPSKIPFSLPFPFSS